MTATVSLIQTEISEHFSRWIRRRTAPANFVGDEQAEEDELASLLTALVRYAPRQDAGKWVDRVTSRLEDKSKYRVWPSRGEVIEACEEINGRSSAGKQPQGMQLTGDKLKLSHDQLFKLENEILQTARRWVREIPGLANHGRQTLAYWGEEP